MSAHTAVAPIMPVPAEAASAGVVTLQQYATSEMAIVCFTTLLFYFQTAIIIISITLYR